MQNFYTRKRWSLHVDTKYNNDNGQLKQQTGINSVVSCLLHDALFSYVSINFLKHDDSRNCAPEALEIHINSQDAFN